MVNWKIIYYETSQGKAPVFDFIQNLDERTKSKVIDTLDLLKEFGIDIGLTRAKKLTGTNLWELRILGRNNIRILYVAAISKTFLLLHGFEKKKQKTPKKEIKTAIARLKDYNSIQENPAIYCRDELNTDMSSSFRGNRGLKSAEDVMRTELDHIAKL